MDLTPKLPPEIREFTHSACTNVYQLLPREGKLYGTETLVGRDGTPEPSWQYGDWNNAELLLLAQDASNADLIKQRRDEGHPDPFCAFDWRESTDGNETNRNLHWLAQQIGCPKLYGSAYAGLLKHGDRGAKPPRSPQIAAHKEWVLRWVVDRERTPKLRAVACLGSQAKALVAKVLCNSRLQ